MRPDSYVSLDFGVCTFSEVDTNGFIGVQTDVYGGDTTGCPTLETHYPFGFLARPLDPDESGACLATVGWQGDTGHVWPEQDPRVTKLLPKLPKGGSVQYGADGTFLLLDPDKQTATLYVVTEKDGSGTPTKAHVVTVGKDANGVAGITILAASGQHITLLDGGKHGVVIANKANDSWLEVNDDGISLNGNTKISGNIGTGNLLTAWMAAVVAACAANSPPIVVPPPPISLTV